MSRRLVLDDGRTERDLVLRERILVGRDPACDVSDADPRLSRQHAEFVVSASGLSVKDLNSRNGVRVNGRLVQQAQLAPGDLVEIGHLAVRFIDDAPADPAGQGLRSVVPRPVEGVSVKDGFEDDRTRVVAAPPSLSTTPSGPVPPSAPVRPTSGIHDAGDASIRPSAVAVQPARVRVAPPVGFGVRDLFASPWGLRVLGQGMLLALVVFLITVVPLLNWFTSVTGPVPSGVLARMLAAPLLAAMVAGLMVASLIARTTARGLDDDDQPQT